MNKIKCLFSSKKLGVNQTDTQKKAGAALEKVACVQQMQPKTPKFPSMFQQLKSQQQAFPTSTERNERMMIRRVKHKNGKEKADDDVVAVIVTILNGSSYDDIFRKVPQEANEGECVHTYQCNTDGLAQIRDMLEAWRAEQLSAALTLVLIWMRTSVDQATSSAAFATPIQRISSFAKCTNVDRKLSSGLPLVAKNATAATGGFDFGASGTGTTATPAPAALPGPANALLADIRSLEPDAVVFNFECCSGCSDKGFHDSNACVGLIAFMLSQGHMVMCSDFSFVSPFFSITRTCSPHAPRELIAQFLSGSLLNHMHTVLGKKINEALYCSTRYNEEPSLLRVELRSKHNNK